MSRPIEHRARKRFGQNFLVDQNIIFKIVHSINPQPDDLMVEIGPGLGALTGPLLEHLDRLHVIELDRDVIPKLIQNTSNDDALEVHEADVLKFDFAELVDEDRRLRVVGNLPYNISTPVLFHLLEYHRNISDMHFMLQREVVERICARPRDKSYGRLTVMMQSWFDVENLFVVSPHCFSPAPKVDSAIIRMVPTERYSEHIVDAAGYADLVRQAFTQRRKTLRNTLKPLCSAETIEAADIDPSVRAEELGISDFLRLHQIIQQSA